MTRQSVNHLPVQAIHPHPRNVRDDLGDVSELAASIRTHGIIQPLVVTEHPAVPRSYLLLAGHRRLEGAKRAGLTRVPCIIRHDLGKDENTHLALMLVENGQRRQLTPLEKARAIGRLLEAGLSQSDVSRATGMHVSSVNTYALLLELDDDTAAAMEDGEVTAAEATRAVREARATRRRDGGTPARGRPIVVERHHLTWSHPLADVVRTCTHSTRPMVGGVGCGQCWEDAIRHDTPAPMPVATEATAGGGS